MEIHFGTSGWRGIIADDFTFANVKIVSLAIAKMLVENGGNSVVVGYDTRFLSEDFARIVSEVLINNNIKVYFSLNDIPTPVIAYEITHRNASGGINITASHNDYYYNGIKFSAKSGGPALPEETEKVEQKIYEIIEKREEPKTKPFDKGVEDGLIIVFDKSMYGESIKKLVDLDSIRERRPKIIYEPFFATGRRYLPPLLQDVTEFKMIHGERDTFFGKLHPEPIEVNLIDLSDTVISEKANIGLSTDGDADRFGIIDESGRYISPDKILPIIYYYLLTERHMKGNVARTISTSQMLDRIAFHFGYQAIETPVGFKYIGDEIVKGNAIFGGEESGGATISGWLADKDGILADLLVTEIVSKRKKSPMELFNEIIEKFGEIYSERLDFEFGGDRDTIARNLKNEIFGIAKGGDVSRVKETDGIKVLFKDDSWLLFRFSGTEKKIRAYCESSTQGKLEQLKKIANSAVIKSIGEGIHNDF
jgi:alpha-D-glucose phosphate-specific phosphoglucomutase